MSSTPLKLIFHPAAIKVVLTSKDGWQSWLQRGRTPEKIYRDHSFLISTSTPFKMQLACDRVVGDTCAISNTRSGHAVPVDVLVSMPNGIGNDDDSAVSREPLNVMNEQIFKPSHYVDTQLSTLHFEI